MNLSHEMQTSLDTLTVHDSALFRYPTRPSLCPDTSPLGPATCTSPPGRYPSKRAHVVEDRMTKPARRHAHDEWSEYVSHHIIRLVRSSNERI
jgi:hypothetical protein